MSTHQQKEGKAVALSSGKEQIWPCWFFFLRCVSPPCTHVKHLTFFFSDNVLKNSLQEEGVPFLVGRQKDAIILELREGTLLPAGWGAQAVPLTASLLLCSTCLTTRTGTSLAAWQTSAGSQGTPMWSMAPSAMAAPQFFLRALPSILTLVSKKVSQGSWDMLQPPCEPCSRQRAGSLMPGHRQRWFCCRCAWWRAARGRAFSSS